MSSMAKQFNNNNSNKSMNPDLETEQSNWL